MIRPFAISIIALLAATCARAQYLEFVENKGQWESSLKFIAHAGPTNVALLPDGYRVHQNQPQQWAEINEQLHFRKSLDERAKKGLPPLRQQSHAWFVNFLDANPAAEMVPEKPLPTYNNYFQGNNPAKWASNCRIFNTVTAKNVYPGVDVRYYTGSQALKYDIIIQPGTSPDIVRMQYNGIEKLRIKNNRLIVPTSVGEAEESIPLSYQPSPTGRRNVDVKFKVNGNILTFKTGDYDKTLPLVIDPSVVFCSYNGSPADNWGFTATYGSDGSVYTGAMVRAAGFPTSAGAYDDSYNGGGANDLSDIGIFKFNSSGSSKLYATYIGGSGDDQAHSIIADGNNNLIIAGRSNSGANYPATTLLGPLGNFDIILTKLNAGGTALLGSARIGGTGDDGVNITTVRNGANSLDDNYGDNGRSEVNIDNSGNIVLASCTRSNNFFTTAGAFQTTFGGSQDGAIIKMDATLTTPVFSSYFGGSGNDAAYVISIDKSNNNIYVAGGTESPNLPGDKTNAYQGTYQGATDGFLTAIQPDGLAIIKTTYLGTSGKDQAYGVQFDRNFFPYVTGTTSGSWPVQNATYSNPGGKQFIAKMAKDLSGFVYSTVFGTNTPQHNISPVAFLVDQCENVYVAGWGGSVSGFTNAGTSGLPVTADAIQSTTDGQDIYFFVLSKNATGQLFGSYFGVNSLANTAYFNDHVDGGTSRFDPRGAVYMAICACSSNNGAAYPVTAGVYAPQKPPVPGSGTTFPFCNLAALKISFNLGGVDGEVQANDTMGCMPLTVNFSDLVQNAVNYDWDFGDGNVALGAPANITHTYNTPGVFRARMIAIDLNSCNLRDTSYINIRVRNDRATIGFTGTKLPPCQNLSYQFVNNSVAPPGKPFSSNSFIWDFGDGTPTVTAGTATQTHTYVNPGSYTVRMILRDTNYCNAPDTVRQVFSLSTNVKANFSVPNGCAPYNAVFTNNSLAGATWEWNFGDGNTSTLRDPVHTYNNPGTYTVTLVANDPATCNFTDTLRLTLTVNPTPVAGYTFFPNTPQENVPTQFTNLSIGADSYNWDFGDGTKSTDRDPLHQFNQTGNYDVCLIARTIPGCADTICLQVPARVLPLLDIPNAFSPNGDGRNDKVYVRGFGIKRMIWRIYNRFGQLVFETTNNKEGWDGKFKGILQPMDAYAYTLDAEFVDGQKLRKTGDITLLR